MDIVKNATLQLNIYFIPDYEISYNPDFLANIPLIINPFTN